MVFDADAYIEALGPPAITINGVTHHGRFLSLEEWLPFEPRLMAISNGQGSPTEIRAVIQDYCNTAFPSRFRDLVNPFRKTVTEQILKLPPAAMIKAAESFFESQARSNGMEKTAESEDQEEIPENLPIST